MKDFAALFEEAFQLDKGDFDKSLSPDDVMLWDSLGHMNLVAVLEDEYGVEFEVDEISEMTSAGKMYEILTKRKGA